MAEALARALASESGKTLPGHACRLQLVGGTIGIQVFQTALSGREPLLLQLGRGSCMFSISSRLLGEARSPHHFARQSYCKNCDNAKCHIASSAEVLGLSMDKTTHSWRCLQRQWPTVPKPCLLGATRTLVASSRIASALAAAHLSCPALLQSLEERGLLLLALLRLLHCRSHCEALQVMRRSGDSPVVARCMDCHFHGLAGKTVVSWAVQ